VLMDGRMPSHPSLGKYEDDLNREFPKAREGGLTFPFFCAKFLLVPKICCQTMLCLSHLWQPPDTPVRLGYVSLSTHAM
jgi:hypothetical protein